MVEQPEDGGPRRLYCSPAHRAAARKMRHAARMDSAAPQQAASDVTQPIAQAPRDEQSEQPTTERITAHWCISAAIRGKHSPIWMPGTLVSMGRNSPRISTGASVLISHMS